MAVTRYRGAIGVVIAGSMVFGSTAAVASVTPAASYQPDPWAVLSVMSGGASAVAVCGATAASASATAAVAQTPPGGGCVLPQVDVPPAAAGNAPPQPIPVPPVETAGGYAINPLYLALLAIAAGVGLYFIIHHHHGNSST